MKVDEKRFMNPTIIDRCGLINFKRQRQEMLLKLFLLKSPNALFVKFHWERMTFTVNYTDLTWNEFAAEDVIKDYNANIQ